MKRFLNDIFNFLKSMEQIDILLYFAVLVLVILVISLIYIIKNGDEEEKVMNREETSEDFNLKDVVEKIENRAEEESVCTSYELEQEEKAIISYDELLEKSKHGNLDYATEEIENEEIAIKKINLDSLVNAKPKSNSTKSDSLFNYEKEEAFLESLQALNELLN